jgi:hypothetical protein
MEVGSTRIWRLTEPLGVCGHVCGSIGLEMGAKEIESSLDDFAGASDGIEDVEPVPRLWMVHHFQSDVLCERFADEALEVAV